VIVGICGGSSSGKSFITSWLKNKFKEINYSVQIIKEKNFLIPLENKQNLSQEEFLLMHDFDNYQAIDW
jgi:uridine kinase